MTQLVLFTTEKLCLWCGAHLMYKKRGTRGQFCRPDHARFYRKREDAKRMLKLKCTEA